MPESNDVDGVDTPPLTATVPGGQLAPVALSPPGATTFPKVWTVVAVDDPADRVGGDRLFGLPVVADGGLPRTALKGVMTVSGL